MRVKKTTNGIHTYYPFAHYHLDNGYRVKYYFFNGVPVARYQANGNNFMYLHADHLGSVVLTTHSSSGAVRDTQTYCAYGKQRNGTNCTAGNALDTSKHFTGQDYDSTGLHYYRSRYYDDHLGQFISPDSIVPDATSVFSYNRFMYTAGNPLNRVDPTGHVDVGIYLDPGTNCWHWCGTATMNPRPHPMAGSPDLPTREQIHLTLDIVGTVDPTGAADAANAVIYAAEGDYVNTLLSAAALIPLGDALKAGKYADEAVEIVGRNVDEVVYGEHVLKRIADNPNDLGHNFPTLLDGEILSGTPAVTRTNGQQEFLRRGSLNETNGVYHITVGSDGKTVTHRFFIGESDWGRFSTKYGLPDLEDIP